MPSAAKKSVNCRPVRWRATTSAFQYRIADHLGNTVVFFEDRDGDAKIKTESMTSDPDSLEVLQRNYYYPFGLEMEGPWQAATAPRADYLYNSPLSPIFICLSILRFIPKVS
jgi:hypothetical protein